MNTKRSSKLVADYLNNGKRRSRKIQEYERKFDSPIADVFFQLCPSRECDWIPGWDCDLIYTTTGYVEPDCIFSTSETNSVGPGLWIFTRYELNERVELVRIIGSSLVIHLRIRLIDNGDNTTTGKWHLTFTALDDAGDAMVNSMPDQNPEFNQAIDGLEHFLKTGELLQI